MRGIGRSMLVGGWDGNGGRGEERERKGRRGEGEGVD